MRKLMGAVAAVVVLGSTAAVAAPYGDAGCGLGSLMFGDKPGFIQVVAATFNGSFGSQTFGISTGTLNCGDSARKSLSERTKVFVEANREVLAKDISRGQGETIANLSALAGCSDAQAVGAKLQSNFQSIFPSDKVESTQVTESLLQTLKGDSTLACTQLM